MIIKTGRESPPPVREEGIGGQTKLGNGSEDVTTERKCEQKREFTPRGAKSFAGDFKTCLVYYYY